MLTRTARIARIADALGVTQYISHLSGTDEQGRPLTHSVSFELVATEPGWDAAGDQAEALQRLLASSYGESDSERYTHASPGTHWVIILQVYLGPEA